MFIPIHLRSIFGSDSSVLAINRILSKICFFHVFRNYYQNHILELKILNVSVTFKNFDSNAIIGEQNKNPDA
jgi:hypothetical protein